MNFYTVASKLNRQIAREATKMVISGGNHEQAWENAETLALRDFERNARRGIQLMLKFKEIAEEEGLLPVETVKRTFFITVRPKCDAIDFDAFTILVGKFLQRKDFIEYTYSFEQKGTSDDTLGHGFHVHIVAHMRSRSKGEVLRDTCSTFKHVCAANCIQVDVCKNPQSVIQGYLLNYESEDGHKANTKEWDAKWRQQLGLADLYSNKEGGPNQVQLARLSSIPNSP